ncbi:phenylalanine--tRNA ligase subunit beta [Bdellovibrio sp. HCB337]|uniref:phenylalanine--tRNA ligase subunit beta n=1 Tax=Bdellovibrio sp. HCB337 TaxID=3394358 RepID=UPI0039A6323E
MKISLKWLQDFVDINDYMKKPDELGELLTRAGLEVEETINRAKDYQHVVVGLILEKDKHPNADKLSLCKVTTGEGVVHQIVCGAQNHKANDRVIVALPGAVLPGNFVIKKAKVRDVESGGMLCSYKELGLAKESDGIAILPTDAPVGKSFAEFGGYDDVIFELKVTPNRADCLSHYGLAREIACVLGRELKPLSSKLVLSGDSTKKQIGLEVKNSDLCPRYAGRFVKGVRVQASPEWLVKRLEAVGLNSINNVVDVTNYVMMELGQPLHAFDAKFIEGSKIVVSQAQAGEKFKTLDGTEVTLKGSELMIRDANRPVAMAGVVGGQNSGVSETTTDIFIEAAYFLPMAVRKASRGHGIETDSAYRFSRGVDPDGTVRAMDRAADLIVQLAGGTAFGDHHDFYPNPVKKNPIEIAVQTVSDRMGYVADEAKFADYMRRLGCQVTGGSGKYSILPPTFRFDLEQDMDLVEEYARLHGYENIPESLPVFAENPAIHDKTFMLNMKLSQMLRGQGFSQAFNYAFVGGQTQRKFLGGIEALKAAGFPVSDRSIQVLNPLNEEMDTMRSSLSTALFKNLTNNFHQGNHLGRLYEIGQCFYRDGDLYKENTRMALMAWGHSTNLWNQTATHPLVFEVKAAVEVLLKNMNINSYTWVVPTDKGEVPAFMHRGQFAQLVVEGKKVGYIGTLHPVLLDDNKIRVPAAMGEFDMDQLYKGQPRPYRFESLSKFPAVERDFALVMAKNIKVGEVVKEIRKQGGGILTNVDVFDVYEGDKLEAGKKSVALRLTFQDKNATLQDNQVVEVSNKILESLKKQFALTMR